VVAVGAVGCALGWTAVARADEGRARELFREGTEALHLGRFPEARDLLRESLEMHPHQAAAFNLVVALRGTEQPVEAVAVCDGLVAGTYGELDDERRVQADVMCADVREDVATLEVVPSGPAGEVEVRVDGRLAGAVRSGRTLAATVNPGAHVIDAAAPEHVAAQSRVSVRAGSVTRVPLHLAPVDDGGSAVYWWIGASAAAVAIATAIVLVVLLSGDEQPLENGTLFPEPIGTP
jgi:hypothetical protein